MTKKLYFGNLSYETTDQALKDACAPFGAVESAVVITDKMSGRSKGFGFVEMATSEEAAKVVEMLNGKNIGGRDVKVSEARPREDRPVRSGGGYGGGGQRNGGGYNKERRSRDW
jgi:RNA recognition motif-containing protein